MNQLFRTSIKLPNKQLTSKEIFDDVQCCCNAMSNMLNACMKTKSLTHVTSEGQTITVADPKITDISFHFQRDVGRRDPLSGEIYAVGEDRFHNLLLNIEFTLP